ncbi:hypothetical protein FDUTEX481_02738 [Tolypothrix sp. PCC 7601]|nr:hypothetical protein FDUTEX481_02738 [Tolypothrix sp. PCC 7601]
MLSLRQVVIKYIKTGKISCLGIKLMEEIQGKKFRIPLLSREKINFNCQPTSRTIA